MLKLIQGSHKKLSGGSSSLVSACVLASIAGMASTTLAAEKISPSNDIAKVTIESSKTICPVNRRIFGHNILNYQESKRKIYSMQAGGLWDPDKAAPVPEMLFALKETGATTLRWPGGCGSHVYNWKKTVGPLEKRPHHAFGLPEFLQCCKAIGAEPVITLGDYWGSPKDFADIVEYLNSPVGKNPNGGVDWAAVRSADGHPAPYNVVWFEYGNESNHGPHCKTRDVWFEFCYKPNQGPNRKTRTRDAWYAYTVTQYAELYRLVQKTMKAVDPKIKLGAILGNEYHPRIWHDWTYELLKLTGSYADFYITHIYMGSYNLTDGKLTADELFRLAFTSARQTELVLKNLSRYIKQVTGRSIPLAITEFNCGLDQEKPVPYRFSQGAAIQVAEMALTMMYHPEFHVDNAQYWQFFNEHWGMISNFTDICLTQQRKTAVKRPPFLAYALCNKYLGDTLVRSKVSCRSYSTNGGFAFQPSSGSYSSPPVNKARRKLHPKWIIENKNGYSTRIGKDGSLSVKIENKPVSNYRAEFRLAAKPLITYEIAAQIKTDGNPNVAVSFEVQDGRGSNTYCRDKIAKGTKSTKWAKVSCQFESLLGSSDLCIKLKILGRNLTKNQNLSFSVRDFTVREVGVGQDLGRIPYIKTYASLDKNGGTRLILVNRNITSPVKVKVRGVKGSVTSAETLTSPSVDSTNEKKLDCRIVPLDCQTQPDGTLELTLPPHSISGLATR